jgi:hypothetical protein
MLCETLTVLRGQIAKLFNPMATISSETLLVHYAKLAVLVDEIFSECGSVLTHTPPDVAFLIAPPSNIDAVAQQLAGVIAHPPTIDQGLRQIWRALSS